MLAFSSSTLGGGDSTKLEGTGGIPRVVKVKSRLIKHLVTTNEPKTAVEPALTESCAVRREQYGMRYMYSLGKGPYTGSQNVTTRYYSNV